ncbi:MAG: LPS assembly protein LptD [Bryobacteraceae bacterium]
MLPPLPPPSPQASKAPLPALPAKPPRPNAPGPDEAGVASAIVQSSDGPWLRLRGKAEIETHEMLLRADEVDYNQDTGYAEARGNAYFQHFTRREELWADKVEYNTREDTGRFYKVRGSGYPSIEARPGVLTTSNPFHFEGVWAERIEKKYILYDGFITNCKLPKPTWTLHGPKFDIIPGERAIAHRAIFRVRRFPLFYAPFFYKSLERAPRRSGFLTPNLGNSSRRGKMIGIGYYWAINRSYDVTYRVQNFTQRGFAHHVDFRGKPREGTDFDAILYGVDDKGLKLPNSSERIKQGGFNLYMNGRSDLGRGFQAYGNVNYVSSLTFRQAFTETFNEAIFSEVHSVGFVNKGWSSYNFNVAFARLENFQSDKLNDSIVIRKLPEIRFSGRDRRFLRQSPLPLWFSFDSSVGLVRRTQPLFQTRQFLERADFQPRVTTALRWKDFHVLPSFSLRETHYGERQLDDVISGRSIARHSRDFRVDLIAPALSRTFGKSFLGDGLKHVIEPRAAFRHVGGIAAFHELVRFDDAELLANTTEAEVLLVNRLYVKRKGQVWELFNWELSHRRFFDPDFGGAVVPERRNVVMSALEMTPYAFLHGPRSYSPVVSVMRIVPQPFFAVDWRVDYDPFRQQVVNSGFTVDGRVGMAFASVGHNHVRSSPLLSPSSNQFRGQIGFGNPNRRGWTTAFTSIYDFRIGAMQFSTTQVTYNTDCCGVSVQFRRFNLGTRVENQIRVAFAVANIGSFGTLRKNERLF